MKKANIIVSLVLISFTGVYAYFTSRLPDRNLPNTLGSDFMPWLLATILFILSGCLLLTNATGRTRENFEPKIAWREVVSVIVLTVFVYFYVKAIQLIGFLYITPFFLAALMWISGARKWKEILILSAVSTVGIYLFFQKVFKVLLPQGTLF
jgi:hypothetical protein